MHFINTLYGCIPDELNADLNQRTVVIASEDSWQATTIDGLSIRLLECIHSNPFRFTAQLKLNALLASTTLPGDGLELLLQQGQLSTAAGEQQHAGFYLRHSLHEEQEQRCSFTLHTTQAEAHSKASPSNTACQCFVAAGQIEETDTQTRHIDTNNEDGWFPGPKEGTEVFPLHLHNRNNSMLIRWREPAELKPKLDPHGEEILVLAGQLSDEHGVYSKDTWIRNPVREWQSWQGQAGTLIYYKNGHISDSAVALTSSLNAMWGHC